MKIIHVLMHALMLQAFESSEEEGGDSGEDGMPTSLLTPFSHW